MYNPAHVRKLKFLLKAKCLRILFLFLKQLKQNYKATNEQLVGCCAIGKNMTTLHRSSVMFLLFCAGSQFPFTSSLKSVCWSISRFMGLHLGICATTVRKCIHPLLG